MNPVQEILWTERSRSGRLALEEGDLAAAEEHLSAALVLAPDQARQAESLFHLARLRFAQHNLLEAEHLDRAALALRPGDPTSSLVVALFYGDRSPGLIETARHEALQRFGPGSWQVARLANHDFLGFGVEEDE